MAIEHIVRSTDSLESLAAQYLGDASRIWDIIDYNGISYPYLVDSRDDVQAYADGYVHVVRANSATALTIRKGWTFLTKPYVVGGMVKTYKVTEDTILPAGELETYVHIQCMVAGPYGNTDAGLVVVAGPEFLNNSVALVRVTNETPIMGADRARVIAVGEPIYIPVDDVGTVPGNIAEILDDIAGVDIALDADGDVVFDGDGDLKTVGGLDNLKQAVEARLTAERGDLPIHPDYGTDIPTIIGGAFTPYKQKLVELEIYQALSSEDRIQDVAITSLNVSGTSVTVDLSCRPVITKQSRGLSSKPVNVSLNL